MGAISGRKWSLSECTPLRGRPIHWVRRNGLAAKRMEVPEHCTHRTHDRPEYRANVSQSRRSIIGAAQNRCNQLGSRANAGQSNRSIIGAIQNRCERRFIQSCRCLSGCPWQSGPPLIVSVSLNRFACSTGAQCPPRAFAILAADMNAHPSCSRSGSCAETYKGPRLTEAFSDLA